MREVGYQDCLESILQLWPKQLKWKAGSPPSSQYNIKSIIDYFDNIIMVIEGEKDEVSRELYLIINFCIFTEYHNIIKKDIDSGVNFGTLCKSQLGFDYIKTNFSEHLSHDSYKELIDEFDIVVTQISKN